MTATNEMAVDGQETRTLVLKAMREALAEVQATEEQMKRAGDMTARVSDGPSVRRWTGM